MFDFLGCFVLVLCCGDPLHAAEQSYEGRPLTEWLKELSNTPAGPEYGRATRAFRSMGTSAIPFLLMTLEADRPDRRSFPSDSALVVNAFREIGPLASNAIPKLNELLLQEPHSAHAAAALVAIQAEASVVALLSRTNGLTRRNAIIALASRSVGKEAVPPLIALLGDADHETRHLAAWALGQVGKAETLTIPALVKAAGDQHFWVRHNVVQALGNFESQAKMIFPVMLRALSDENEHVRGTACRSLGGMMNRFEPDDRTQIVGALMRALEDQREDVQCSAAWALGTPLPETKAAFARLLALAQTSSKRLSDAVRAALKHIDRQAALQAGVE